MKVILLTVLVSLLAGCRYDLPDVDGGTFELYQSHGIKKGELALFQIEALAEWLRAHRSGWKYRIEDRPPALHVVLKQKGKTVTVIDLGIHSIAVGELVRPIAPQERALLVAILAGFLVEE